MRINYTQLKQVKSALSKSSPKKKTTITVARVPVGAVALGVTEKDKVSLLEEELL